MLSQPLLHLNELPQKSLPLSAEDETAFGRAGAEQARQFIAACARYRPTDLSRLTALAHALGVSDILVKNEASRLGLGSFKALGGAYAVLSIVQEHAERAFGHRLMPGELLSPMVRTITPDLTFACATDGNHGLSLAAGARLIGAHARVFAHRGVSQRRIASIARYGAEILSVSGNYDDAVRESQCRCAAEGWILVSDTSWDGYERIPRLVMQGYTVAVRELLEQLDSPVTHVFLQAGVGGFAAAVAAHMSLARKGARPRFVVVEPERAPCLYGSALAGRLVRVRTDRPTVMAMLECDVPSKIAWDVLSRLADGFMTVTEEQAVSAMLRLARPLGGDPAIVAGESGGAGLAGACAALGEKATREALGISQDSRILLFNTEGATDPWIYRRLTGLDPSEVVPATAQTR